MQHRDKYSNIKNFQDKELERFIFDALKTSPEIILQSQHLSYASKFSTCNSSSRTILH